MNNPIYLSTGAFIGRINKRNYRLLTDWADQLICDGFELLFFEEFYDKADEIVNEYRNADLRIPVVHAEKQIGDLMGGSKADFQKAKELFRINCDVAARLSSEKLVFHAWGYPDSDSNPEQTYERLTEIIAISKSFRQELLVENILCMHRDPLVFIEMIHKRLPDLHFIIDTRHAQFHCELEKTLNSDIMKMVNHIHINDYAGGYKEWEKRYPILQPGKGGVDWRMFFSKLTALHYTGSITLEAPSMLEENVDTKTLNKGLDFIRNGLLSQ